MTKEGWHHQLDGREFEQAPGVGNGQGSLACCSPWGCKESDTTEQLNSNISLSCKPTPLSLSPGLPKAASSLASLPADPSGDGISQ